MAGSRFFSRPPPRTYLTSSPSMYESSSSRRFSYARFVCTFTILAHPPGLLMLRKKEESEGKQSVMRYEVLHFYSSTEVVVCDKNCIETETVRIDSIPGNLLAFNSFHESNL